jgi:ribosome-binding protein aMBF1 (putative translation factor)
MKEVAREGLRAARHLRGDIWEVRVEVAGRHRAEPRLPYHNQYTINDKNERSMAPKTQAIDDLESYVADRDAREPGFVALVVDAEARRAFGREMAERRRASGTSQTQVAASMRTSAAIVSRLESGSDVRLSTLEKYVAALGLQLELKAVTRSKQKRRRPRKTRAKK